MSDSVKGNEEVDKEIQDVLDILVKAFESKDGDPENNVLKNLDLETLETARKIFKTLEDEIFNFIIARHKQSAGGYKSQVSKLKKSLQKLRAKLKDKKNKKS